MDKCRHCGTELPPTHTGPCPKCGREGKVIDLEVSDGAIAGDSLSGKHKPQWSSKSLAVFSVVVAVFLGIVVPGILYLLPFSLGVNYGILVGFLVVAGSVLWWQRYRVLMLIRWVEGRFGGEKGF